MAWNVDDVYEQILIEGQGEGDEKEGFRSFGVSPDRRFVVAGGLKGNVYYRDMSGKNDEEIRKVEVEEGKEVWSLAFGQDEGGSGEGGNVVYVGTAGAKVCEVNLSRGEVLRTFTGHTNYVYGLAVSPNGKTLISVSLDKTARVWDLTKEAAEGGDVEPIKVIEKETMIICVAYNADGTKFCIGGQGSLLHVYDSTSYERLAELKGHTDYVI